MKGSLLRTMSNMDVLLSSKVTLELKCQTEFELLRELYVCPSYEGEKIFQP